MPPWIHDLAQQWRQLDEARRTRGLTPEENRVFDRLDAARAQRLRRLLR